MVIKAISPPEVSVDEIDTGILNLHSGKTSDRAKSAPQSHFQLLNTIQTFTSTSPGFCSGKGRAMSSMTSNPPVLAIATAFTVEGYGILSFEDDGDDECGELHWRIVAAQGDFGASSPTR